MFRMLNNIKPKTLLCRHIALLSNLIYQMVDYVLGRIFYECQPSQLPSLQTPDLLRPAQTCSGTVDLIILSY